MGRVGPGGSSYPGRALASSSALTGTRLWIELLSIVEMSILHKLTYRFNTIPIKTTAGVFADVGK